jgi:hypothetical protein
VDLLGPRLYDSASRTPEITFAKCIAGSNPASDSGLTFQDAGHSLRAGRRSLGPRGYLFGALYRESLAKSAQPKNEPQITHFRSRRLASHFLSHLSGNGSIAGRSGIQ